MIDYEKEADARLEPFMFGSLRRELMRLTLYRLTVDDVIKIAERRTRDEYLQARPGEEQRLIFEAFKFALVAGWPPDEFNRLADGRRVLSFGLARLLIDDFIIVEDGKRVPEVRGTMAAQVHEKARERWEKAYSAVERVGYVEQMEAYSAGVPLEHIFPDGVSLALYGYSC